MKFINPENIRNISFYVQRDYSAIDSLQTFSLCLFSVMGRWLSDDENFFHLQNISHFSMIFTIKFDKTSLEGKYYVHIIKGQYPLFISYTSEHFALAVFNHASHHFLARTILNLFLFLVSENSDFESCCFSNNQYHRECGRLKTKISL